MYHADVAQLVERDLAKVEVAGSSPVVRSNRTKRCAPCFQLGTSHGLDVFARAGAFLNSPYGDKKWSERGPYLARWLRKFWAFHGRRHLIRCFGERGEGAVQRSPRLDSK